jgi:hypothetical protein
VKQVACSVRVLRVPGMHRSARTASQRSRRSSQAVAMVSSSAAGVLGGTAQGRANDAGSTPRWREPGWRTFSMKAAEIRPPEVVMWVGLACPLPLDRRRHRDCRSVADGPGHRRRAQAEPRSLASRPPPLGQSGLAPAGRLNGVQRAHPHRVFLHPRFSLRPMDVVNWLPAPTAPAPRPTRPRVCQCATPAGRPRSRHPGNAAD